VRNIYTYNFNQNLNLITSHVYLYALAQLKQQTYGMECCSNAN